MIVYIKGAGDLASGIALRLYRSHFSVIMTDLPEPTAVRRTVCFSEAIRLGKCRVEDVYAVRAENAREALMWLGKGVIPVLADPEARSLKEVRPEVLVDAIMAKKNTGTSIKDASTVIGVGPGFTVGVDCHAVIETKRGHTLGRVIRQGTAIANTGVPGVIAGRGAERLLRASADGIFCAERKIGDLVKKGDRVASVNGVPVLAQTDGMIRGMLPTGLTVYEGMKAGDVGPRGAAADFTTVSDKSLAIAGGALEAILEREAGKLWRREKGNLRIYTAGTEVI